MDEFIVSARKYRPTTFDTVVGQENITQTLLKAIRNNHLGQAFLFNGPRGVGKTTCARILAREVNQFHTDGGDENQEFSFNIFELDAASNNKVEDIRNLIDQVRIPPQIGKYKVYIIDEVHMLSSSAFNAFLKTLEEPPAYAIFILATTEKHKVLPTIISRCQVFDFQRITISMMVDHLARIAVKEHIAIEDEALHVIAEKADGALRDALSMFDQMVSFSGSTVKYEDVIKNLNILDYDYYFALCENFRHQDTRSALITFNQILEKGFDGHNFINGLADHMRNLLMCTSPKTTQILEVGENVKKTYMEEAPRYETENLVKALEILGKADLDYKLSRNQRLMVEVLLLRLCTVFGDPEKKNTEEVNRVALPKPGPAEPQRQQLPKEKEVKQYATSTEPQEAKKAVVQSKPEPTQVESTVNESVPHPSEPEEPEKPAVEKPDPPKEEKAEIGAEEKQAPAKKTHHSKLGNVKVAGLPSLKSLSSEKDANGKTESSQNEEEARAISYDDKPADPFNLARLWEVWNEYAAEVKEADKQSYYATLTKRQPVMREKNLIELLVDNHVQLSDLDEDRANLLAFLREKLNNWQIQLKGVIDESEAKDGDGLYDPVKRFAVMAEKNPAIKKMKDQFDLDIDYDG